MVWGAAHKCSYNRKGDYRYRFHEIASFGQSQVSEGPRQPLTTILHNQHRWRAYPRGAGGCAIVPVAGSDEIA